ncbi:hypothetical protein ACFWXK_01920 [Streptomyces sp. NPDC059070]|uniref:hypothetical protein n=1 Tax=Streptomyces sp. NPDC059070 TaxID=3346713 RepID=UPI0036737A37
MHRHVRTGTGALALAACLTLAGCSSSDNGDKAKDKDGQKSTGGAASSPSQSAGANGGGSGNGAGGGSGSGSGSGSGPGSGKVAAKDIAGAWAAVLQGKPTALVISGTTVALGGEHTCTGTVNDNGMAMIELKCADGNTDRVAGMPSLGPDGKTLTVKWEGGTTDKFTKSELDGKVPPGMTAGGVPAP